MTFRSEEGYPGYRVGIVGLSWITAEPARQGTHRVLGPASPHSHLSSLAAIPAVKVVAGCDISPDARESFLGAWTQTWPDLKAYGDYREMIDEQNIDILCVATPDHLHGDVVRYAAEKGVKGVFCEKPISVSLEDVDSIIAAVEQHSVAVNINNTRRWVPSYVAAREAVRSGKIGDLVQIIIHFGGERAMLWRNHSHFLDLFSYFADSDPQWVMGELDPEFSDYGLTYRGDGGRDPEREPGVNAYIAYSNGVRGFLSGMKSGVASVNVQLVGSGGRIEVNDKQATLHTNASQTPLFPEGSVQTFQAAILDLINALETGEEPQCPPKEARKTVAIIEAILKSHQGGNIRVDLGS